MKRIKRQNHSGAKFSMKSIRFGLGKLIRRLLRFVALKNMIPFLINTKHDADLLRNGDNFVGSWDDHMELVSRVTIALCANKFSLLSLWTFWRNAKFVNFPQRQKINCSCWLWSNQMWLQSTQCCDCNENFSFFVLLVVSRLVFMIEIPRSYRIHWGQVIALSHWSWKIMIQKQRIVLIIYIVRKFFLVF